MKKLLWILLVVMVLPCVAVEPQQIDDANDDMLMWMDKFTWTTYTNDYTGEVITVSVAEKATALTNAIAAYNLWKSLSHQYAQELGMIN